MFDVSHLIQMGGLLLIALLIFGESGMFIGFFFPGDTLLISAGVFAAQGKLELGLIIPIVALAAILGDNAGYFIGKKFGRRLFSRKSSVIFSPHHLQRAEAFFTRFGPEAMLLAHFVPIVRTFAPPVAGVSAMPYKKFFIYDAIGDTAWATIMTLIGYWFGSKIPNIDNYIMVVVAAVVLATLGPAIYHFAKAKRQQASKESSHDV